jgi:hypothetical protein
MRTLFTLLIFLLAGGLSSQTPEWIHGRDINYSMNPEILNYTLASSPDGNIWYAGLKNYIQPYNDALGDLFISLVDKDGNVLEDYEITGSMVIRDMKTDEDGFLYLAGQTLTDISFWDGYTLNYSGPHITGFLARISPDRTVEWAINLNVLYNDANPGEIFVHQGNIYLAHYGWMGSNITEFDTEGTIVRNIFQHSVSLTSGMAVDNVGNIYVTGSCADSQSMFGGIAFPSPFQYSIYLVKYDPNGNPQWVKFIEDITCPSPKIVLDNEGRLIWTAEVISSKTKHSSNLNNPEWVFGLHITSLNSDGDIIWQFSAPYTSTGDAKLAKNKPLQVMPDNSISLAGVTRGMIDWGNGVISGKESFDYEVMVLNISAEGQAMWAITGGGQGHDLSKAIEMDTEGNLYIAGVGHGTIHFDTCSYTGNSFYYPFALKINTGLNTGWKELSEQVLTKLYPIPARDYLIVEPVAIGSSLVICNLNGQEVMRHIGQSSMARIDVSILVPGLYFLKLIDNDSVEVQKIIIN